MSGCTDLTRPVMSSTTCFHPDQRRRQIGKKALHLPPFQLPVQQPPTTTIHRVHLEHVLCHIHTNHLNIHLLLPSCSLEPILKRGTSRCRKDVGGVHIISFALA